MKHKDADLIEEGREFTDEELEQYFREADEEEPARKPWIATSSTRRWIIAVIGLVMVIQVLAWWPQIFSLDAIRFLQVSSQLSRSDEIKLYKESVVVVRTEDAKGTGFIITHDGLIVTNRHVIEAAEKPSIKLPNGKRYTAQVVAEHDTVDLALLKIDGDQLPFLPLADHSVRDVGQPIYVIGNPLFFTGIANEGVTKGITVSIPSMMVLDAPVYKGNSGSPVITPSGEVIGVVYATSQMQVGNQKTKVGLAVPVEWIQEMLASE